MIPGRAVAILKADVGLMPALALASANPAQGTETYVVGYPGFGEIMQPSGRPLC